MDQIGPKLDHKGLKIVVLWVFFAEICLYNMRFRRNHSALYFSLGGSQTISASLYSISLDFL